MKKSLDIAIPEPEHRATRRARILAVAGELFGRHGFRKLSMEAVAEAAQVAKATLYSYYRHKEELFAAVAGRMADDLVRAFQGALEAGGPTEERIRSALVAKNVHVFQAVRGLPNAGDLFAAKSQLAQGTFEAADARMIAALATVLAADAAYTAQASLVARTLFFGAHGLAEQAADAVTIEREVDQLVVCYLAGVRLTQAPEAGAAVGSHR